MSTVIHFDRSHFGFILCDHRAGWNKYAATWQRRDSDPVLWDRRWCRRTPDERDEGEEPEANFDAEQDDKWALLVGVSEYPSNPERSLEGPKNDVILASKFLNDLGVPASQIKVLVDGVNPEDVPDGVDVQLPTRENILKGFGLMAVLPPSGDLKHVVIHMSGHGAQQPDADGDETDGYDEIFLPRDIGKWLSDVSEVENAIDDDTLNGALQSIRANSGNVVAIFDSCHSGTMTRGAPLPEDISSQRKTK